MGPTRILVCADRDNAGSYSTMVEFASHEEAMDNSNDPATSEFAEKMGALNASAISTPCPDRGPAFLLTRGATHARIRQA